MRETKFRAYDKKDCRYIVDEQEFIPLLVTNKGVFRSDPTSKENKWILIDKERFEIEEWSGFTDENGVEIYEGDVIQYDNGSVGYYRGIKKEIVEFTKGMFVCKNERGTNPLRIISRLKIEVIGNIHENKELKNENK